jgi:hypothetical protein
MLKDSGATFNSPQSGDLSLEPGSEINTVVTFVDNNIGGFYDYYLKNAESDKENWIVMFWCGIFKYATKNKADSCRLTLAKIRHKLHREKKQISVCM